MMALEIAIDEMAEKLGLDPIEFRILNDTQVDPEKAASATVLAASVSSSACASAPIASAGASAIAQPGKVRDGRWLVGMGVAAAFRNNLVMKSAARVRLDSRGIVTVETDMTDIGTGSYTIIAQTAAEMMGVPLDKVVVRLGDSTFPVSCRLGRAMGCATARPPAFTPPASSCARPWRRSSASTPPTRCSQMARSARAIAACRWPRPRARAASSPRTRSSSATSTRSTSNRPSARISSKSASTPRPARSACGACSRCAPRAASSIPKSARSQVIGAMTMGVGAALMEELAVDKRLGFFVNHDLAGYEVPVHADIPHQEVIFLDETDPMSSPMKAKGVGELGICGVVRPSPTRSTTLPACACATIRSRSTSSSTGCRTVPEW